MQQKQGEIRVRWSRLKLIAELEHIANNKHAMKLTEFVKHVLIKEHANTPDKYKMHPTDFEKQHG